MKIGIVCYPTYGGSGVMATELGKALADKGHHVHFISSSLPVRLDTLGSNLYFHEVTMMNYPLFEYPPYETALISKLVDVIKYEKLDILHVHYAIPHAFAAYVARQILAGENIRIPVVTTLHGTDITLVGRDSTYEPAVTFSINNSDAVTAVSEYLREETFRHFEIKKEIRVIPNFVDFERFSKKSKEHFKIAIAPFGEKIIVHTSNFRPVKRIEDVVEIFARIRKVMPAKLLLVGDGPERSRIEMMCRQLDICSDVRFLGKIEAVEEVLSIADLFLLPSEKESFGLSALEAMACQVPVISSNTEGIPEVNINGATGFLSDVGDVEDMAKNALYILSTPEIHHQFKTAAYERASQFGLDKIMHLYEDLYLELLRPVEVE
ncbi:MAG: N-acetyl-alpha-D-glucosaminyl L-malate synthase BshA [Bacteroidota bacterium]|nr:N-acetyl-alpha-D-glucosaminyl L-malate synthase BshA [Bacteroidota bacterium]